MENAAKSKTPPFFCDTVSVLVALVAMLVVNGAAAHAIGRYDLRQSEQLYRVPNNLKDNALPHLFRQF